jgi:hypothetical protein
MQGTVLLIIRTYLLFSSSSWLVRVPFEKKAKDGDLDCNNIHGDDVAAARGG